MTSSKTKLLAVIGNPIEHSISPQMHTAAFLKMGLDYLYLGFKVTDLKGAIGGIRALGLKGINVTIPHKVDVMKYLDDVDELAVRIGAVNTVVNEDGVLKGYNTDCSGAVDALLERTKLKSKNVVILGAGGAARAVAFGVLDKGASVVIVNRTERKAVDLVSDLSLHFPGKARFGSVEQLGGADILVNTTPVGMYPHVGASPVGKELLGKNLVVMDIVYNPIETQLLRDARSLGCVTISGLEMFVGQGARSFELFTGKRAPKDVMKAAVVYTINK